jgi:uncharacterized protein YaiL (DUF2058 family)
MSNSLKDQLLGLGFTAAPEPPKKPKPTEARPPAGQPTDRRPGAPQRAAEGQRPRPQGGKPAHKPSGARPPHKPQGPRPAPSKQEFDLGKAYAMRAQKEKDERIAAEAAKQEEARLRREARAKLAELLKDKALNDAGAEHVRHFEYGGKIKRVHVTPEQLAALNRGELGVLQSEGRYVLVSAEVLAQAKEIFPAAIALEVDPNAPAPADDYADPKYQVPDDLAW